MNRPSPSHALGLVGALVKVLRSQVADGRVRGIDAPYELTRNLLAQHVQVGENVALTLLMAPEVRVVTAPAPPDYQRIRLASETQDGE